jgi:nitroimidazol reductase NimA-like FMN-containing flavoprotein (pyridoxamine 5'-phosphate oxidase superfamily)
MTAEEIDDYLAHQRVCRIATVSADGAPHQTPLHFVWVRPLLWVSSVVQSQRWKDIQRDPRVSAIIDSGATYAELQGVELRGTARIVGEVPRLGAADAQLEAIEQLLESKYRQGLSPFDGKHAWLAIAPSKIVSWDFRKLAALTAD